mgnify:CR=1 FL=1
MSNNNWRTALIYNCLGPYHYARVKAFSRLVPDLLVIEVASSSALYVWLPGEIERTWKQEKKTLFPRYMLPFRMCYSGPSFI